MEKTLPIINKVYHEDSIEYLKTFPDESVDMIFADPPYFGNQKNLIINRIDGYSGNKFFTNKAKWAFSKKIAFQLDFAFLWLKECKRILKTGRTIWVTGTYHSIGVINVVMQELKYKILNEIILVKKKRATKFFWVLFSGHHREYDLGKKK